MAACYAEVDDPLARRRRVDCLGGVDRPDSKENQGRRRQALNRRLFRRRHVSS